MLSFLIQTAVVGAIAYDGVKHNFAHTTALYNKVSDAFKAVWNSEFVTELSKTCKPAINAISEKASSFVAMLTGKLKEHNNSEELAI